MKKRNVRTNGRAGWYSRRVRGEMNLCEIKGALDEGGKVTILIRHAERPPLEAGDAMFGASLALTERGWRMARQFGALLANTVRPKAVAFYAGGTFRTVQTACGMAMGLDVAKPENSIERKIDLVDFLGSGSPFFGPSAERMAVAAGASGHERMNEYFRRGELRGYRPLGKATGSLEARLHALHRAGGDLVVAVTHDINVTAFLAARGVVESFTDETWPDYLDAAAIIKNVDGRTKYIYFRWNQNMGAINL